MGSCQRGIVRGNHQRALRQALCGCGTSRTHPHQASKGRECTFGGPSTNGPTLLPLFATVSCRVSRSPEEHHLYTRYRRSYEHMPTPGAQDVATPGSCQASSNELITITSAPWCGERGALSSSSAYIGIYIVYSPTGVYCTRTVLYCTPTPPPCTPSLSLSRSNSLLARSLHSTHYSLAS